MSRAEKPPLGKLRELDIPIRFGDDFTGDKGIYVRIVKEILLDRGWMFGGFSDDGNPVHIGNNKYEFDIVEYDNMMASMGGRYLFWIDDLDRVRVKKDIQWMS